MNYGLWSCLSGFDCLEFDHGSDLTLPLSQPYCPTVLSEPCVCVSDLYQNPAPVYLVITCVQNYNSASILRTTTSPLHRKLSSSFGSPSSAAHAFLRHTWSLQSPLSPLLSVALLLTFTLEDFLLHWLSVSNCTHLHSPAPPISSVSPQPRSSLCTSEFCYPIIPAPTC